MCTAICDLSTLNLGIHLVILLSNPLLNTGSTARTQRRVGPTEVHLGHQGSLKVTGNIYLWGGPYSAFILSVNHTDMPAPECKCKYGYNMPSGAFKTLVNKSGASFTSPVLPLQTQGPPTLLCTPFQKPGCAIPVSSRTDTTLLGSSAVSHFVADT